MANICTRPFNKNNDEDDTRTRGAFTETDERPKCAGCFHPNAREEKVEGKKDAQERRKKKESSFCLNPGTFHTLGITEEKCMYAVVAPASFRRKCNDLKNVPRAGCLPMVWVSV